MKTKRKPFEQHLYHDIEDEDKVWEYLDDSLPMVGMIVMYFNGLEKLLDMMLCEEFTDRTDSVGLIVLHNMNFSAKVNLFGRFSDEFHRVIGTVPEAYHKLLDALRDAADSRNLVVHADWENTDDDGFTYVKLRFSKNGMEQEYVQLSEVSLSRVIDKILDARNKLGIYWDSKGILLEPTMLTHSPEQPDA